MAPYAKVTGAILLVVVLVLVWRTVGEHLDVATVKAHRAALLQFVETHYAEAVILFIGLYISTALIVPGALALTVAAGMLFGTLPAMLYVNIGATAGATIAFLTTRLLLGSWVQERFEDQLRRFNREVARHGHNYLLMLRILPVVPFFVVNYGAGVTRIPLRTFLWTTSLGMLPGSFVYTFAGQQLRQVEGREDLFSGRVIIALALLALFAILPVIHHHFFGGESQP